MKASSLLPPLIGIGICIAIGWVISYYSGLGLLGATMMVMFALFLNGFAIYLEDREPGGWDYVENETEVEKSHHRRALAVQVAIILVVLVVGLVAGVNGI